MWAEYEERGVVCQGNFDAQEKVSVAYPEGIVYPDCSKAGNPEITAQRFSSSAKMHGKDTNILSNRYGDFYVA